MFDTRTVFMYALHYLATVRKVSFGFVHCLTFFPVAKSLLSRRIFGTLNRVVPFGSVKGSSLGASENVDRKVRDAFSVLFHQCLTRTVFFSVAKFMLSFSLFLSEIH